MTHVLLPNYSSKDISVIIPTYNRAGDVRETLRFLMPFAKELCEIIIVDQSKNDETKKVVQTYQKKHKNLVYVYSKVPSITIARNLGVKQLSKKVKIVCFIDDDVTLGRDYFKEILAVFNTHSEAKGVAGYVPSPEFSKMPFLEKFLRRIFYINYPEKDRARMISPYGNTYPSTLSRIIHAQWLPGVNMVYHKEVFKEQQFDEHLLGYTVAEDIDFTYQLSKKYPGSLLITPFASLTHRVSSVQRTPTVRMSYINQVDHFYFQSKHMNSLKQRLIFSWSLTGILVLRSLKAAVTRKQEDTLKLKYFLKSLFYCINNSSLIRKGKVREFPED